MMEAHDVTSARYITSPNPTFALPPRASDAELKREAAVLTSSVSVLARSLPARTKKGTPCQRHESTCRRIAAYVATFESGATPASSR